MFETHKGERISHPGVLKRSVISTVIPFMPNTSAARHLEPLGPGVFLSLSRTQTSRLRGAQPRCPVSVECPPDVPTSLARKRPINWPLNRLVVEFLTKSSDSHRKSIDSFHEVAINETSQVITRVKPHRPSATWHILLDRATLRDVRKIGIQIYFGTPCLKGVFKRVNSPQTCKNCNVDASHAEFVQK